MNKSECYVCEGRGYKEWQWVEAFDKFGFEDGDGQRETQTVMDHLKENGYECNSIEWGLHNEIIISIKKDGVEYMPQNDEKSDSKNSKIVVGYSCPYTYLPEDIINILDKEFGHGSYL